MPLIFPSNTLSAGGFSVDNSCRFNEGSSDYLQRTPGGASDRKTWTLSCWIKRGSLGSDDMILSQGTTSGSLAYIYFNTEDRLGIAFDTEASGNFRTDMLFRDISAWYHIVIACDTTESTEGDRVKTYVNGSQVTYSTESQPAEDYETQFNTTTSMDIGRKGSGSGNPFDGYMAEYFFIDGQALTPTSFGEFDEDSPTIWKPKNVSGLTFGTNGFYLDFEDSADLGADVSGNSNDFTVNNLTSVDQSTDTPTLNYPTLNPLIGAISSLTISEGNLNMVATDANYRSLPSTMAATAGKWYAEFKAVSGFATEDASVGIYRADNTFVATTGLGNFTSGTTWSYGSGGLVRTSAATDDTEATYTDGDIIQVAMDLDNLKLYFGKNNTWINSGDPESGATGTGAYTIINAAPKEFYNFAAATISSKLWSCNFGSPSYANSSDAADENGYGAFEYAPPSGYYAMNSANLAEFGG